MKYTVIRHNLTALDLSKKPAPRLGELRPQGYTIQCKPPGGSVTCRAVFVVPYGPEIFLCFFLCGKRFCAQNLCRRTLC